MNRNPFATARAASTLSALAVLSPLAGMAVEITLAWRFGTSPAVDAFRIGALLLVFGQQLFVIQILPHAVVPVFAEYRAQRQEKEAWQVALALGNLLLVPTLLASLLVFVHPEPVVRLLAPGLTGEAKATAALFIRCFFPACATLVWSGVAAGILYAHKVFWLPPAAQLVGNLVLIAAILGLGRILGPISLVVGVLLSAVLGAALYAVKLTALMRRAGVRFAWKLGIRHPGVRKTLRLALPLLGTILLSQWVAIVMNRTLSALPPGNLALFGYAWKLGQLASLIPITLATVMFPQLADARFSSTGEEFRHLCTRALRMALFLTIPLACLLYVLRHALVTLVFERGAFSADASQAVARLFGLLLLGAPAAAALVNMEKMFYAGQRMRLPMYAQMGSAVAVTVLSRWAANRLGADGLMLLVGTLLVWLMAGSLLATLFLRHEAIALKEVATFAAHISLLALASAWVASHVSRIGGRTGFATASAVAAGALVFFSAAVILRVPEAIEWRNYLRWQGSATAKRLQELVLGRT